DMHVLINGNVEFDVAAWNGVGGLSGILEVTQQSQPETVLQMDETPGSLYRAFRIPSLYPNVTW
ncbi:MAG: aryl-sulfate sulfotransferase, partial [Terriglobia bacterium]